MKAPAADDSTPLPVRVIGGEAAPACAPQPGSQTSPPESPATAPSLPTAEALLRAVAAAEGPWFPSRHAAEASVPRDSLDEPLDELRLAGLVRVTEWVRGVGQGYVLTPEGQAAAKQPGPLPRPPLPASTATPGTASPDGAPPTEGAEPEAESPADRDLALRPPLVVPVLLMANALWFFVCAVVGIRWGLTPSRSLSEGHPDVLHRFGAVSGADLLNGEWWRLLTACFVHIGVLHLVGNMFALAMMGPLAELLWGRFRLLLIYLISGLAGSALAMTLRPDAILAGASGAIWGIQMSLFAWLFAFRRQLPPDIASDWFRRLGVVFVLNAVVSFLPGVSWEGHLGGGVAGFLAAGLLNAARFGGPRRRAAAWFLLAMLQRGFVGALASAMDAKGMTGWQRLRQKIAARQAAREWQEQREKLAEEVAEFNAEAEPRLAKLSPDAVRPAELEAGVLLQTREKHAPQRAAAVRARVAALKGTADEVVRLTLHQPVGSAAFELRRARVRQFAAARAHSLALLLAMLDAPGPPSAEAWNAWQSSRRAADRLWKQAAGK